MGRIMRSYGFSLIELMVVIVIVGSLAAISIPAYQSYYLRAGFAKVVPVAESGAQNMSKTLSVGAQYNVNDPAFAGYPASWANSPSSAADYIIPPYGAGPVLLQTGTLNGNSNCRYASSMIYLSNFNGDFYTNNSADVMLLVYTQITTDKETRNICTFGDAQGTFGLNHQDIITGCTYTPGENGTGSLVTQLATQMGC